MATLSIIAALGWQLLALLLILLRPDLHPSWQTICEWAIGPFGWLIQLGFLLSASYGALFWSMRSEARGKLGTLGLGFLLICTFGTIGVGLFVTDPHADHAGEGPHGPRRVARAPRHDRAPAPPVGGPRHQPQLGAESGVRGVAACAARDRVPAPGGPGSLRGPSRTGGAADGRERLRSGRAAGLAGPCRLPLLLDLGYPLAMQSTKERHQ